MMAEIKCYVTSCKYHQEDGGCGRDFYYVALEEKMTSAGFVPTCSDYREDEA